MPDRIVHVAHPFLMEYVPRGGRKARIRLVRTTTPARLREVDPREMVPAVRMRTASGTYDLTAMDGGLWTPLPIWSVEGLTDHLEGFAAFEQLYSRAFGGTPLATRDSYDLPGMHVVSGAYGWVDREPVRTMVQDGEAKARERVASFMATRLVVAAEIPYARLAEPLVHAGPVGSDGPAVNLLPGGSLRVGVRSARLLDARGPRQMWFDNTLSWIAGRPQPHRAGGTIEVLEPSALGLNDDVATVLNALPDKAHWRIRYLAEKEPGRGREAAMERGIDLPAAMQRVARWAARAVTGDIALRDGDAMLADVAEAFRSWTAVRFPDAEIDERGEIRVETLDRADGFVGDRIWSANADPVLGALSWWRGVARPRLEAAGAVDPAPDLAAVDEAALEKAFGPP